MSHSISPRGNARPVIAPQPGFQTRFLSNPADIVIGGGAAGAGKSFALLMEAARYTALPDFHAIIFRRTAAQARGAGGLWDTSAMLYPPLGARPLQSRLCWVFPSGATIRFGHLQYEKNIYDHQGTQYPFIGFDELTHFSERQFLYLLSRNRSVCGVRPYVRATCNPEPGSWLARWLSWWIHPETGRPLEERAGRLRYFLREGDEWQWGDTEAELQQGLPARDEGAGDTVLSNGVKSLSFVPGKIQDNPHLLSADPGYLANLMSQDAATRASLLEGNWLCRPDDLRLMQPREVEALFMRAECPPLYAAWGITCDVARYGRDLAVIGVWKGWQLTELNVFTRCDLEVLYAEIEKARTRLRISPQEVIVDEDGVGGGLVDRGRYTGFRANAAPAKGENYQNLKTQCYFRLARAVEEGLPALAATRYQIDGMPEQLPLKRGRRAMQLHRWLAEELAAIRRVPPRTLQDKYKINTKDAQKSLLDGLSPDLADALMLRAFAIMKAEDKPKSGLSW